MFDPTDEQIEDAAFREAVRTLLEETDDDADDADDENEDDLVVTDQEAG